MKTSAVEPAPEDLRAFADAPDEGPVVMLNLIKLRADGGAQLYARYSAAARPLMEARGARVLFSARGQHRLVGEEDWDLIFAVEYPAKAAFFDFIRDPEYQKIRHLRTEAAERAVLYASRPVPLG